MLAITLQLPAMLAIVMQDLAMSTRAGTAVLQPTLLFGFGF